MGVLVSKSRKLSPLGWFGWMLYQPYKWLIFAPFFVSTTLFFGTATIVLSIFLPSRWVSLICGTFWSRLNGDDRTFDFLAVTMGESDLWHLLVAVECLADTDVCECHGTGKY
jgi:hypothetical protein